MRNVRSFGEGRMRDVRMGQRWTSLDRRGHAPPIIEVAAGIACLLEDRLQTLAVVPAAPRQHAEREFFSLNSFSDVLNHWIIG